MQKIKDLFNKIVSVQAKETTDSTSSIKEETVNKVDKIDKTQFEKFYKYYNYSNITNVYKSYDKNPTMTKFFRMNPFVVKVMFENNVLSMEVDAANSFAMDFLVLVGYFFDHYDEEKNCVWTNNLQLIRNFFEIGTEKYLKVGGKIIFDFTDENVRELVTILLDDQQVTERQFDKLCENFYQVRKLSWINYKKKIFDEIFEEEINGQIWFYPTTENMAAWGQSATMKVNLKKSEAAEPEVKDPVITEVKEVSRMTY